MDNNILKIVRSWFIDLNKTIKDSLFNVEKAVVSQEYPKNVKVDNLKDITAPINNGLNEVVKTIKDEINKLDKEIKVDVKNDLPNLYKLFKKDKDKKDLVDAINGLGKLIPTIPENKDYEMNIKAVVLAVGDVIKAIEKNKPEFNIDFTGVEKRLEDINKKIEFKISEELLDHDNIKVKIDEQQFQDLYNSNLASNTLDLKNKLTSIDNKVATSYSGGSGSNGSVTLTNANTAYAVPTTASVNKHSLVLYNGSDTDIYWGFENSNANGVLIAPSGLVTLNLGANQQVYAYCGTAGKIITYTYKDAE